MDNNTTQILTIDTEQLTTVTGGAIDTNGRRVPGPQPIPYSTVPVPGRPTQSVPSIPGRPH